MFVGCDRPSTPERSRKSTCTPSRGSAWNEPMPPSVSNMVPTVGRAQREGGAMFRRMLRFLSRQSVALVALFVALGGTAVAAGPSFLKAVDVIPSGDLAGSTYGNPVITSGAVDGTKLASGAVDTSKFSSTAKAPNADTLDGLDSTAFMRGAVHSS